MTIQDAQRLWRQFSRFAEYEDLKELYQRCIPEIGKFEHRILEFSREVEKFNFIIRKFDEDMMLKAEKISIKDLQRYCDETFELRGAQDIDIDKKVDKIIDQNNGQIMEFKENIKLNIENVKKKLFGEIRVATTQLKGSYFDG